MFPEERFTGFGPQLQGGPQLQAAFSLLTFTPLHLQAVSLCRKLGQRIYKNGSSFSFILLVVFIWNLVFIETFPNLPRLPNPTASYTTFILPTLLGLIGSIKESLMSCQDHVLYYLSSFIPWQMSKIMVIHWSMPLDYMLQLVATSVKFLRSYQGAKDPPTKFLPHAF